MTYPGSETYDNVVDLLAATRALADRRRPEPSQRHAPRTDPAVFRIRIALDDTPVWRVVDVRSDIRLNVLHDVVQVSMGWLNSHLHLFIKGAEQYLMQFSIDQGDMNGVPEGEVRLDEVLAAIGDQLRYEYDFGDGWEHTLTLEEVRPLGTAVAVCIDGAKAGPPEDCGGIPGYETALEAVADPSSAEPHLVDWLAGWDPDHFDVGEINALLDDWATMPDGLNSLADPGFRLPEPVADLVRRIRDRDVQAQLVGLATAADLSAEPEIDPAVAAAMVRPYQWLLDRVGPGGLALTGSGYLKPADVLACAHEFFEDDWIGKLNRESQTPPVLHLRESAQRFGLVRKLHGKLLLTAVGKKLTGDPVALWRHLAAKAPIGDEATRDAGRIVFLLVAHGAKPSSGAVRVPLVALGWGFSDTEPIDDREANHLARPTVELLERLGALPGWRRNAVAANPAGGVAFARAALRT